jgi:hypothetical protein
VSQIRGVEAAAELSRQRFGKAWQQLLAICRTRFPALLSLHDMAADLPAGLHLHHVHRPQRLLPTLLDQRAQRLQQAGRRSVVS